MFTRSLGGIRMARRRWVALAIATVLTTSAGWAVADEGLDIQAIIRDTQKMSRDPKSLTMAWWMPDEFWEASIRQNPSATQATVDEFVNVTRKYTMVAVADGKLSLLGSVTYASEQAVRSATALVDQAGTSYAPLDEDAIAPDMKNLLSFMRPVIASLMGPLGQNIHFLLFPAKDRQDRRIADAKREGGFSVKVGTATFKYRLPLGSVLPPKFDPKTGERFPGNYLYSPFTAVPLVNREPGKAPVE